MGQSVTLGGERLGSGKKQKVYLHGYERSTHDLGYLFRSTMSVGTLVPFMCEVGLPGDTFDINLDAFINTLPTIGPLFGSGKLQLDVFEAPFRLYQGWLHNNKVGIGTRMNTVKLPLITLTAVEPTEEPNDLNNSQINPSCILKYLGISGVGIANGENRTRTFNAIPLLAYAEIYKQYYANKQEEIGAVIHNTLVLNESVLSIDVDGSALTENTGGSAQPLNNGTIIELTYAPVPPDLGDIIIILQGGEERTLYELSNGDSDDGAGLITINYNYVDYGDKIALNWRYRDAQDITETAPTVVSFPLADIDTMREKILANAVNSTAFDVNGADLYPYKYVLGNAGGGSLANFRNMIFNQEGLLIKTYQSDIFNNWLNSEWIDGTGGINDITKVSTAGDSFTIPALIIARKVYDMLNRVAVSGGTYDDWIDANWDNDRYLRAESPIYHGGLIKEIVFQEVVSNSESGDQPLGTLAGKGRLSNKHKGGYIHINVHEPSYIIGIVSITPRIDYSQGNRWDTELQTMDDLHKPALDQIGFQELITERMAWWTTKFDTTDWVQTSAGKQPAWLDYMTNYNRTYGNFAVQDNQMFMTFNRRYEHETDGAGGYQILDLTTYIDPVKFNYIFAQTSLDAQNYWIQIAVDITARRKMSAKVMPTL